MQMRKVSIHQKERQILKDVNLDVRQGEFIYLIGRTGTGKTSLLKTMYGALPFISGNASVVGFDLSSLDWRSVPFLRRKMGIVFQDFQLLTDRNVEDNLLFALESTDWVDEAEMDRRITNVLHAVGISEKRFEMPFRLSGGEQQRVVIARALLNDPLLILADEPTGNLDPQTSEEILRLLHQICQETATAIIMGTHDLHTIRKYPARMLICNEGHLIDGGTFH